MIRHWKILTPHLIQTGKLSISILIVLGVAPLLFTQVIYDPTVCGKYTIWYVGIYFYLYFACRLYSLLLVLLCK